MVFWILIGLIAAAWVIAIVMAATGHSWFSDAAGGATIATIVIVVVGFFVLLVGVDATSEREPELTAEYGLRALITEEATETHAGGVFFLGFGYASSSTTEVDSISYIQTAADGGNTIHKVGIGESVIYEGSDSPYVEEWQTRWESNGWWVPWELTGYDFGTTYRFHIPTGSIYEGYEVTP